MNPSNANYYAYVLSPNKRFPFSQRIQRLLIFDFAQRYNLDVTFYVAEIPTPGAFPNLEQKILEGSNVNGFIFYSSDIITPFNKGAIFLKKLLAHGYDIWFAVEEIRIQSEPDIDELWCFDCIKRIGLENERRLGEFFSFLSIQSPLEHN